MGDDSEVEYAGLGGPFCESEEDYAKILSIGDTCVLPDAFPVGPDGGFWSDSPQAHRASVLGIYRNLKSNSV